MSSPLELFRRLTTGVYVVTASHAGKSGGFTAAWVTQASFEPLLVALSVNPGNATWRLIQQSGRFTINVLTSGQLELARHFGTRSGRDVDKLPAVRLVVTEGGALVLRDAAAWIDCRLEQQVTAGDHLMLLARVVAGDVLDPAATPLRYDQTGDMDGSSTLYPAAWGPGEG